MKNDAMDRRSKYSIQSIQNALLEILEKKSLEKITITEVCQKADVNRGTFYKYYQDIYELYDTMEDQFVENLQDLFTANDEQDDFFLKVTMLLHQNQSFVKPHPNGVRSSRFLNKLLQLVEPEIAHQVLLHRPDLEPDAAHFLGEYIIGGCARMYEVWINEGMTLPVERVQQYISTFVSTSMHKSPS